MVTKSLKVDTYGHLKGSGNILKIKNSHSCLRGEHLNREWLLDLREVRVVIEDWRQYYNRERPHSRLGYFSPEEFIKHKNSHPDRGNS